MNIIQFSKKIKFFSGFIFVLFLYGWSSVYNPFYFDETNLKKELILNAEQQNKIKKIFLMINKQKINEKKIYKDNPEALYRVALQRRRMQDNFIEKILEKEQITKFKYLKDKRDLNNEFFIINEILFPDKKQTYQIKDILDEYKKKINAFLELRKYSTKKGEAENRGAENMRGSTLRSSMRNTGANRGGIGTRPDQSFLNSPLGNLQQELYTKIEKILTKNQKKGFYKVEEILKAEFKKKYNLPKKR